MSIIKEYNGHTIEIEDDPEELNSRRYHKFNLYSMIDQGIGSDMESVDKHYAKLRELVATGMTDEATREIDNLRTNLYFVIENINPKMMSFAPLVNKINGKKVSEENVTEIVRKVNRTGVSMKIVSETLEYVKKKLMTNFIITFLKRFMVRKRK